MMAKILSIDPENFDISLVEIVRFKSEIILKTSAKCGTNKREKGKRYTR